METEILIREGKEIITTEKTWCDPDCQFFPKDVDSNKCLFGSEPLGYFDFYLRAITCLRSTNDYPLEGINSWDEK